MAFSSNLQHLRKEANLSQEKLAEQLHITRQAVSKWESGQALPDADTCLKLCEVLGVSPNCLLLGEEQAPPCNEVVEENTSKKSSYTVFSIFMMVVLLCGTILLVINMYNGIYFEPIVHVLAFVMIVGSILAFGCVTILRTLRKKVNRDL